MIKRYISKLFRKKNFGLYFMKVLCIISILFIAAAVELTGKGINNVVYIRYAEQCLINGIAFASVGFGAYISIDIFKRNVKKRK